MVTALSRMQEFRRQGRDGKEEQVERKQHPNNTSETAQIVQPQEDLPQDPRLVGGQPGG